VAAGGEQLFPRSISFAAIGAVSGGWPQILSNLKSLLETGSVVLPPKESRA
jgi:hypothetical protein